VKHTKGPWRVAKVDGKKLTCVYTDRTNIALLVHQEDANLIASAPELLEALKQIGNMMHPNQSKLIINMRNVAEQAIVRATE